MYSRYVAGMVVMMLLLIPASSDGAGFNPATRPSAYAGFDAADKQAVLEDIATQAYTIISQVGEKGLRASEPDIMRVIEMRRWLESTKDVTARMLAIALQYEVDGCVIRDVTNSELYDVEREQEDPEASAAYDAVVDKLLAANAIDEEEYINYALSQNEKIADECNKQGVTARHIMNRTVFRNLPKGMLETKIVVVGRSMFGFEEIGENESREFEMVWDRSVMPVFYLCAANLKTKEELRKLLLPFSLGIFEARADVMLLLKVYREFRQAGKAIIKGKNLYQNKELRECIEAELSKKEVKDSRYFEVSDGLSRLAKRVNAGQHVLLFYTFGPFVRDAGIFGRAALSSGRPVGHWLDLVE